MNNFKKIGLTALASSLVAVSAHAGELSVTGGANATYKWGSTSPAGGTTGKSIGELAVSTAGATTAGDNFRIIGIKDDFDQIDVTSAGVIFLVKLNVHFHLTATGL